MDIFNPIYKRQYDPISITLAAVAFGAAGFGIAELAQGISKTPDKPAQPALPDPTKANNQAAESITNQRKLLLASGGQTDFTGGSGVLNSGDVSKSVLLGGG